MLLLCLGWSSQFSIIKGIYNAAPEMDASLYSAIRFSICLAIFSPKIYEATKTPDLLARGVIVGCCVFVGYIGQSYGLQASSAGTAAFIASLSVVWVAFLDGLMNKNFQLQIWVSCALAVAGTALLELGGAHVGISDLWLGLQPLGFGTGYVLLSSLVKKYPEKTGVISAVKLGTAGVLSILWATASGHTTADVMAVLNNPPALQGLLFTSLITTAFAVWVQSIAFRQVSASDASIILSSEPAWAAAFAIFWLGETYNTDDLLGAMLIVSGGLSNEFKVVERVQKWWGPGGDDEDGDNPLLSGNGKEV